MINMIVNIILIVTIFLQLVSSGRSKTKSEGCGKSNTDGFSQTTGSSQTYTMTVNDPFRGDMTRTYIVHLPPNYNNDDRDGQSVLFALPGFLTSAQEFEDGMKINSNSDDNNYIIVYAQGHEMLRGNGESIFAWNDESSSVSPGPAGPTCDPDEINNIAVAYRDQGANQCGRGYRNNPEITCIWTRCDVDDVYFIEELASKIEEEFCIDTSRQYITGFSNGGMMTQRVACELNKRFAAAATLHGQLQIGFNCAPNKGPKMPIMNVYGTNDQLLPGIANKEVNLVNGVPGTGTMAAVSRSSWYFLPVVDVQDKFADFNGCDKSTGQMNYATVNNAIGESGNRGWECTAFRKDCADAPAVKCSYLWQHATYPVDTETDANFIMPGVWEFLSTFDKPQ